MYMPAVLATIAFAANALAHGRVTSPTPRPLGDAMKDACGQQVYNQMASDPNGNIQAMAQTGANQNDYDAAACHLYQCRGYQFADATSSTIQSFTAGQVVPFAVTVSAPHTGVANVSVINLAENSVIGDALASWSVYASTATGVDANDTSFSVTIPSDLPSVCSTAGGCALQWWWDARSVNQTYMSCVDFTVGSAGSSASNVDASSSASALTGSSSSAVPTVSSSFQAAAATSSAVATTVASASVTASSGGASSSCAEDVTITMTSTVSASSCALPTTRFVTMTVTA